VLDGVLPGGRLPPCPAILLVDPPKLPGGAVGGRLADTTVSGTDGSSGLLTDLDLTSFWVPPSAARQVRLPGWLAPAVWAPGGPLIAAGENGAQRLVVMAFDPVRSDLPDLTAFPLFIQNVWQWATGWLPMQATTGESVAIPVPPRTSSVAVAGPGGTIALPPNRPGAFTPSRPGLYTVTERGAWGQRRAMVAANPAAGPPASSPLPVTLAKPPAPAPVAPSPWWPWTGLAALVVLAGEALYAWRRGGLGTAPHQASEPAGNAKRRGTVLRAPRALRAPLALRAAGACLPAVALALPAWTSPGGGAPILVVDQSASMTPRLRAAEGQWLRAFAQEAPGSRVVGFAGAPGLGLLGSPGGGSAQLDATSTDIAAALRLAVGVAGDRSTPADVAGKRLVLASDGLATAGDTLAAAAQARAQGIPVDVAPLNPGGAFPGRSGWADAAVTRMQAPPAVRRGDTVTLLATVHATVARQALLTLSDAGRVLSGTRVSLRAGDNPVVFALPPGETGWEQFRLTVAMRGDQVSENDALDAVTRVGGPPRLLYIQGGAAQGGAADGSGGAGGGFPLLLRRLGVVVRVSAPSRMPAAARGFSGFDAVVLDDVAAGALGPAQLAALTTAVRTDGRGLLVLGGQHSLTAGWYSRTPLAPALPVAGTGSDRAGSVALELVLDRSGSMADLAGGTPKIDMARAAARAAIDLARRRGDDLGIVAFDTAPRVLLPMQPMTASTAARADRAVDRLTAAGGTNIYGALRAGFAQVTGEVSAAAPAKNIILMTDGVSQSARYDALLRQLRASQVTLSAVGLGHEVDKSVLQRLAAGGGGRYYYTADARDLPGIFITEARRSFRPAHVTGRIPAAVQDSVPAVRSLLGAASGSALPPVGGYVATRLKPTAIAAIAASSPGHGEPLLAQWQYGLGRVAVWTPGVAGAWPGGWARRAPLWDDTLRWLLPGLPTPVLQPRLGAGPGGRRAAPRTPRTRWPGPPAGSPLVEVDTIGNAGVALPATYLTGTVIPPYGARTPLVLTMTSPGRYTAALPAGQPGVYRLTIRQPGAPGVTADAELAVPYPLEYLPSPGGRAVLAQIAALTGGRVLPDPARGAGWERAHSGRHVVELWWPLMLAALILFLAAVFRPRVSRARVFCARVLGARVFRAGVGRAWRRSAADSAGPHVTASGSRSGEGENNQSGTDRAELIDR